MNNALYVTPPLASASTLGALLLTWGLIALLVALAVALVLLSIACGGPHPQQSASHQREEDPTT